MICPLIMEFLSRNIPGSHPYYDALYATATHPCNSSSASSRLLPRRAVVASLLTFPINLLKEFGHSEDAPGALGTVNQNSSTEGILSHFHATATDRSSIANKDQIAVETSSQLSDGSVFAAVRAEHAADVREQAFLDAHLLEPHCGHQDIPVALFCIAPYDEIYSAMSSALMQRRVLGIHAPLLGFTCTCDSWAVQLIVGWTSTNQDHDCSDVHFAHAPARHGQDRGLGVFDLTCDVSADALIQFLMQNCGRMRSEITAAQSGAGRVREHLCEPCYHSWRVDMRKGKGEGDNKTYCTIKDVAKWREECSLSTVTDIVHLREIPSGGASILHENRLNELRHTLLILEFMDLDECYHPLVYSENREWEDISLLLTREAPSADAKTLEILAENKVQPHAWPSPDVPANFASGDMLRSIHNDYLLFLDLGFSEASRAINHDVALSAEEIRVLLEYGTEVACEKELRTSFHLPNLKGAEDLQTDIIRILPLLRQVSEDARAEKGACSRLPWETLLAVCFDGATNSSSDALVLSERSVPFPCSSLFADVLAERFTERRCATLAKYQDMADGTLTLRHSYSAIVAEPTAPGWLHKSKLAQAKLTKDEYERRVDLISDWREKHTTPERDVRIEVRVLEAQSSDICDAVAFVTIPGVLDVDERDDNALRQLEDFRIIGKYAPKPIRYCGGEDSEDPGVPTEGCYVVKDPVLQEVRRTIANTRHAEGTAASNFFPEESPLSARADPSRAISAVLGSESVGTSCNDARANGINSIQLPSLWLEDRMRHGSFMEAFSQARFRILSSVRFYATFGIYDLVVFALATSGSCAHLLCGWGTKPTDDEHHADVVTNIADVNCPVWDLRDSLQAIRFCAFLLRLRNFHTRKICEAFEARKTSFAQAWRADPTARRFQWTIKHQQADSSVMDEIRAERDRQFERFEDVRRDIERVKQEMDDMEETVELQDLQETWPGSPEPEELWDQDSDSDS